MDRLALNSPFSDTLHPWKAIVSLTTSRPRLKHDSCNSWHLPNLPAQARPAHAHALVTCKPLHMHKAICGLCVHIVICPLVPYTVRRQSTSTCTYYICLYLYIHPTRNYQPLHYPSRYPSITNEKNADICAHARPVQFESVRIPCISRYPCFHTILGPQLVSTTT